VDAAYSTMVRTIQENRTPNLFALHYEPSDWKVANLILIPHFAFPLSAVEKRKPLASTARRAGWVGCNILLGAIPLDAKIPVIADGVALPEKQVRQQYARIRPLQKLKSEQRGWTLDVLNAVRSLGKPEFALNDVYAFETRLGRLHPDNRHVRDKIRQQLQVLRDLGLLEFLGRGAYRLR
jgi:type II restriction enzyme